MKSRPVILIGNGLRGNQPMIDALCGLDVPVLVTWQGIDLIPEEAPAFCGRPGVIGQRAANIIQQKATHVYCFGARLDSEQINHQFAHFAPNAIKTVYDIDKAELDKFPVDWFVMRVDLREPFVVPDMAPSYGWLAWCKDLYNRFRYELDGNGDVGDHVDPYYFIRRLGDVCEEDEILVPGSSGMQSCAFLQAWKVKKGQRIHVCNTIGAMGMEPIAIGAALASNKRVIAVTGDGGFFMNMQEYEIVKRLNLSIKWFVFCNGGYGSITTMQDGRFNGRRVGGDAASGFTLPNLSRVAAVWSFPYHEINSNAQMDKIKGILDAPGAAVVRVNSSLEFKYVSKVMASMKNGQFVNDDMADMTPKIDLSEILR